MKLKSRIFVSMRVSRWTGADAPNPNLLKRIFLSEDLEPEVETLGAHATIRNHKHPFEEIRVIVEGNMIMDVGGNQILLRPGDRIEIPANTKHSKIAHGGPCVSLYARRV